MSRELKEKAPWVRWAEVLLIAAIFVEIMLLPTRLKTAPIGWIALATITPLSAFWLRLVADLRALYGSVTNARWFQWSELGLLTLAVGATAIVTVETWPRYFALPGLVLVLGLRWGQVAQKLRDTYTAHAEQEEGEPWDAR